MFPRIPVLLYPSRRTPHGSKTNSFARFHALRYRLAFDSDLVTEGLNIFIQTIRSNE